MKSFSRFRILSNRIEHDLYITLVNDITTIVYVIHRIILSKFYMDNNYCMHRDEKIAAAIVIEKASSSTEKITLTREKGDEPLSLSFIDKSNPLLNLITSIITQHSDHKCRQNP